jgi:biopolymer transport protein ExbD
MNDRPVLPEMNATPLIDVLLVLLVMLVLTLPVATHGVTLNLPQGGLGPPSSVANIHIDFDGRLHWRGVAMRNLDALEQQLRSAARQDEPPRILIVPDARCAYEHVAQVMVAAQRAGVKRLQVAPSPRCRPHPLPHIEASASQQASSTMSATHCQNRSPVTSSSSAGSGAGPWLRSSLRARFIAATTG